MRISVEVGGYTQAGDAALAANQSAAVLTESVARKLAAFDAMAGNDSTSHEFASTYDSGAREAINALADLTHALIGLGRLVTASGANHRDAEHASRDRLAATVYEGTFPDDSVWLRVAPAAPPSSVGGEEPSFGVVDRFILDHVEGFVWPGADTSRLRAAADTWRHAATSVIHLSDHLAITGSLLADQHSPEIPLAPSVIDDLDDVISAVAQQLISLATACEDYADTVDAIHARTKTLLSDIAQMIVEGIAISVIVTGLTGGLGGGATATAAAARVAGQTPRFHALQATVHASALTSSTRLRVARDGLAQARARLEKLARIGQRSDRGTLKNPLGWGRERGPGWLKGHDVPPGHTLDRHVGRSLDELLERARARGKPASSFPDPAAAESLIDNALNARRSEVVAWLNSGSDAKLVLDVPMGRATGTSVFPDGSIAQRTTVRLVLIPSSKLDEGWQILTAFPN